jgi:hypothetical protein
MVEMQYSVSDIAKSAAQVGEQEINQGMENVRHSLSVSAQLT